MYKSSFISKYKPYYIRDFHFDRYTEGTLSALLKMDDLNILINANSGGGKTMLLEALIREYYHLSATRTFPENNILYINNIKEQGISYYRNEMKTFCQSKSVIQGRKKMIVIDDMDNVNEQSQQVFRNYIDRYRENIHFIGVCTNIQKVIESIQSRLHIIQLQPLEDQEIKRCFNHIIQEENMIIDEPSKEFILSISQSIRSVINHSEKLHILMCPIDLSLCHQVCSNISYQHFEQYIEAFKEKNLNKAVSIFYELFYSGYSVIDILDFFFVFIKHTTSLDETTKYRIIPHLCKYITIFHNVHEDVIELALFTNSIFQEFS